MSDTNTTTTLADVLRFIRDANKADRQLIATQLNWAIDNAIAEAKDQFQIGDKVKFVTKTGAHVAGTLININRKTCTVQVSGDRMWRVTPTLLKKAE